MKFEMWSLFHYIFIFSPFVISYLIYYFTKNSTYKNKRIIGLILSIIAIILLLLRNIEIYIRSGYNIQPEIIPLQICHFANFVLLFAFLLKSNTLFTVAFCFNLPFAFLSILFANSLENYSSLINFRGAAYIFGHILIVVITLWALLVKMIEINKRSLKNGIITVLSLFLLSVIVNNVFNNLMPNYTANYFYTIMPESGTPLELAYNWGDVIKVLGMNVNIIYIIITALFGMIIFLSFYLIYKLYKTNKA